MNRNNMMNNPVLANMTMEEIKQHEKSICKEFGFKPEEVNFIVTHKPSILLWKEKKGNVGLKALRAYFVEEHGFSEELVRTLVAKYPHILSKSTEHIENTF